MNEILWVIAAVVLIPLVLAIYVFCKAASNESRHEEEELKWK